MIPYFRKHCTGYLVLKIKKILNPHSRGFRTQKIKLLEKIPSIPSKADKMAILREYLYILTV